MPRWNLELNPGVLGSISEVKSTSEKWRLSCNGIGSSRFTEVWNNLKLSGNCKSLGYIQGWVFKVRKGQIMKGCICWKKSSKLFIWKLLKFLFLLMISCTYTIQWINQLIHHHIEGYHDEMDGVKWSWEFGLLSAQISKTC